jgi:cytochrome c-type biogenesis protein CcsB
MMDSPQLFTFATIAYLAAMVLYISYLAFRNEGIGKAASFITYAGLALQTIALGMRWFESYQMGIGRVPLSNLYESLVFFTWSTVLIYVIVEWKYKTRAFGAFVMPVAFLSLAFINFAGISTDISPLVPALKSNWLFYHVLISFLGYAAFGVAFAVSMVFLLLDMEDRGPVRDLGYGMGVIAVLAPIGYAMAAAGERMKLVFWLGLGVLILAWFLYLVTRGAKNKPQVYLFWSFCVTLAIGLMVAMGFDIIYLNVTHSLQPGDSMKQHLFEASFLSKSLFPMIVAWALVAGLFWLVWSKGMALKRILKQYVPGQDVLDDVTYRMIAIGWPLLTGGIVTGAVWANSAWGTYWSWDPKETWSLITWFVYAIYLHSRYVRGWKGTQMAVISAVGFLAVIFTYLGVNLVLSGLHSYGGMN